MVRIVGEQHKHRSTTTFVQRSSTPLNSVNCSLCCGTKDRLAKHYHKSREYDKSLPSACRSFHQWEKQLSMPICYLRRSGEERSVYEVVNSVRQKIAATEVVKNMIAKTRTEPKEVEENLFLIDPAVMGIKRRLTMTTQGEREEENAAGVVFIRNFFLSLRQCSFIEAHLLREQQQQRGSQLVYGAGH